MSISLSPLFANSMMSEELFTSRKFKKRELVTEDFCGIPCVGIICSGVIEVFSVAHDGKGVRLSQLRQGDCFGISNLFSKNELPTVLKCKSDVEILYIKKSDVIEHIASNPNFALIYAKYCNDKINFLLRRIELLTTESAKNKLIAYFLQARGADGNVQLDCSKERLATVLGISRAALFRELAFLQNEGYIEMAQSTIKIIKLEELSSLLYKNNVKR